MEVNKVGKIGLDPLKSKQEAPAESVTFTEFISEKRSQLNVDKLNKLVQGIEDQGVKLSKSCTIEDLRKYKQLVKEFMQDAVKHGLELEERRGFNRRGRSKVYKIVNEVDKKLLDLTDAVVKKQEKGLQVLNLVGEIKGLLVNIYA